MLWMADHIHVQNPGLVKTLDDILWRNANRANEQLRAGFYEYVNQTAKLSFGVIITDDSNDTY